MKKMLLFLTALAAWHGVAAQDVILLRNADEIKAVSYTHLTLPTIA